VKKLGSILLISIYFFALYRPLLPIVDYISNYKYYSEVLCINKEKPELDCKGQCVLMQKISKKADKENPFNKIIISAEEEIPEILPLAAKIYPLYFYPDNRLPYPSLLPDGGFSGPPTPPPESLL